jgi:hypothetical protein
MKALAAVAITGAALAAAAAAATTITLSSSAPVVGYGKAVTLSGQISTQKANQGIAIQATECGSTRAMRAANVKTAANGSFSVSVTPTVKTVYQATSKQVKSATVTVSVRPVLRLSRASGTYTVKVTAGQALTGKFVLFQRYARLKKRWVQVKRLALGPAVAGPSKPTMITSVSFKAKVKRGTRVRAMISNAQAAPCYVTATSNAFRA